MMSFEPAPAANGTTMRTDLSGYDVQTPRLQ
jgi:hypothetical protein